MIISLLFIVELNYDDLNPNLAPKSTHARSNLECSEYFFDINQDLPIDAGFLIEDSNCVALFLNGLSGSEKLDFNVLGDSINPMDLLIMDNGVYYTYLNEQQYHFNPLSGNYLIENNPTIENLTGSMNFTWSIPSNDVFVVVLDNMRHVADENRGAGGGNSISVSVSIEFNDEEWIWTPHNSIIQLEENLEIGNINDNALLFDEGDVITVKSKPLFGTGKIGLTLYSSADLVNEDQMWAGDTLDITGTNTQYDLVISSDLANKPLWFIYQNQDNSKMASTITIFVTPILNPIIEIISHNSSEIELGETLQLDASSSPNKWGQIEKYSWNIESIGVIDSTITDVKWDAPGEYLVALEITRSDLEKAVKNITINVKDSIDPIIKFSGLAENALVEHNSVRTINCDCSDNHEIENIQWFVDSEKISEDETSLILPTSNLGTQTIKLILMDMSGNKAEKFLNYSVVDATDPELIFVEWPEGDIYQNNDLTFKIKAFDSEDTNLLYRWDFDLSSDSNGDGDKRNDWKEGNFDSATGESEIIHSYAESGTYTVMVQVLNSENRKLELTYTLAISEEKTIKNQSIFFYSIGSISIVVLLLGGVLIWKNIQKRISELETQGKNLSQEELAEIKQKELSQKLYGNDEKNLAGIANMGKNSEQWDIKRTENTINTRIDKTYVDFKNEPKTRKNNKNLGTEILDSLIENNEIDSQVNSSNDELEFLNDLNDNKPNVSKHTQGSKKRKSVLKIDIPEVTNRNESAKKTLNIDLPVSSRNDISKNDDFDI
ncbi:MAG: hypothetical protein CMB56_003625 [Methanobacteriota archaeon]|nr:MAG: hypothetical protein CMB56_003625 [Euryarchaeota archaeon]|tara:strand:- start:620 stop:2950 length:2331 start_codon:yes stop_codon:yes gene_type:complete